MEKITKEDVKYLLFEFFKKGYATHELYKNNPINNEEYPSVIKELFLSHYALLFESFPGIIADIIKYNKEWFEKKNKKMEVK